MHIIACINYKDQGVFILCEDNQIYRIWFDYGLSGPNIEHCITQYVPEDVWNKFKIHLK